MKNKKYLITFLVLFSIFFLVSNAKAETVRLEPHDWIQIKFNVGDGDIINGSLYTYNEPFLLHVSWSYGDDSDSFEHTGMCEFTIWIHGKSCEFQISLKNNDVVSGFLSYDIEKIGDNYNPQKTDTNLILIITIVVVLGIIGGAGAIAYFMHKRKKEEREIIQRPDKVDTEIRFCTECGSEIHGKFCAVCGAKNY